MEEQQNGNPNERIPSAFTVARRTRVYLGVLAFVALGMFGFAYANAKYFVILCQRIGLLTTAPNQIRSTIPEGEAGRPLDVYFTAHVNDNLPIAFSVKNAFQKTAIGTAAINDYTFTNLSSNTIYFRPVHDVAPMRAGDEGTLILEQCFCFTEQKILPGQKYSLPVKYTFTNKLKSDVEVINMSYTLFLSTKEAYERSQAFEKDNGPIRPKERRGSAPGGPR